MGLSSTEGPGMSRSALFAPIQLVKSPTKSTGVHFTAVDFETTALHPGRVIEMAAVRMSADGTTLAELSTLVNPGRGVDPGATWIHHISREQLDSAPMMGDVIGHLFDLCRDSVLVAHNLPFEEKFLGEELRRHGIGVTGIPGMCTLAEARRALRLPNYKLGTVVHALGLDAVATHAALDDARACARLAAALINNHGLAPATAPRFTMIPNSSSGGRLAPRVTGLRAGDRGWMAGLMDRLPMTSHHSADPILEAAYLDLLTESLADGKITGPEAKALAAQARHAGMSAADVRRLHSGILAGLRQVAEADGVITASEARDLRAAATALGLPGAMDDLPVVAAAPTELRRTPSGPRVLILGTTPATAELRAWALTQGAQVASKLTASVTHLVVENRDTADRSRISRAEALGIPIIDHTELRARLATAERRLSEPPAALPVTVVEHRPAGSAPTVGRPTPDRYTRQPTPPASVEPPHTTPSRRPVALWAGRALVAVGAVVVTIALLAALGGAPVASVVVVAALGGLIGLGGHRITQT